MGAKDLRAGEPGQSLTAPDGLRMTLVATPAANRGKRLEMPAYLLMPGTFLAGPPRTAQRIVLGILAAFARAAGRRPYAQPEFDVSR